MARRKPDDVGEGPEGAGGGVGDALGASYPHSRIIIDPAAAPVPMVMMAAVRDAIAAAWALRPDRATLDCVHCWGTGRERAIRVIEEALGLR
jgi:hypothetical protein